MMFFFLDEESKNSASDSNDDGDLPLTPASLQVHQTNTFYTSPKFRVGTPDRTRLCNWSS